MKYLIILISLMFIGCHKSTRTVTKVSSDMCVIKCVEDKIYYIEEMSEGVVNDFKKLCTEKFDILSCCHHRGRGYSIYRECDS